MVRTLVIFMALFISQTTKTSVVREMPHFTFVEESATEKKIDCIFYAISTVESANGKYLFNKKENAVGIIQIRPIMVAEINRLLGYQKYVLKDRLCVEKSKQMFIDYNNAINPSWDYEVSARTWNGGLLGHKKRSTDKYWNKVLVELNKCET